ncbi:PH domain-containing protein [Promicromonospora vindobonensis]|uniref:PH domain-containing protein n=1 Tax=Promicromonospora vindobonensis TaxID=195748 RepID=A0ABW5VWB6_9MICO
MTAPTVDERPGPPLRLRPPRHAVDPRAVGWWSVQLALLTAVPVLPLAVLGVLIAPARPWLLLPAAVLAAVGVLATLTLPRLWFRHHRWEVTDEAVYTRTGWFFQEWRVAPLSRIQTVDTGRGPLEQRFGLATLTVTTASARGAVKVEGLDAETAATLAADLTLATQATPEDAT